MGSAHPINAPYQAFETADGWITIGAANQANWLKLLAALDAGALEDDPRFSSNDARRTHLTELVDHLAPFFKRRTTEEWLKQLDAAGVPAGPVLDISEMHGDPQVLARQMVLTVPHSRLGPVKAIGHPVKFSAAAADTSRGAPVLGEHTREVLREYGFSEREIDELIASGAAVAA